MRNMQEIIIRYKEYHSMDELPFSDRELLDQAMNASENAYSPYSHFSVGAAIKLKNGVIILGNNQENAVYPSGLCAERVAMYSASAQYPGIEFEAIAIVGKNEKGEWVPAMPCGACRQVMSEYENVFKTKMKIIAYSTEGKVIVFDSIDSLLPFRFVLS